MHQLTDRQPSVVEADVRRAQQIVRVHCPISWPHGKRCLNDHLPFPCAAYGWAFDVLTDAGWTAEQIAELDERTGPWS